MTTLDPSPTAMSTRPSITVRLATGADAAGLHRLATLDSAAPIGEDALLAEIDGDVAAAVTLDGGRVVADPFRRTAEVVDLLRVRREQLVGARVARRGARSIRRRRLRPVLP